MPDEKPHRSGNASCEPTFPTGLWPSKVLNREYSALCESSKGLDLDLSSRGSLAEEEERSMKGGKVVALKERPLLHCQPYTSKMQNTTWQRISLLCDVVCL